MSRKLKAYCAGPMTHLPDNNASAFHAAAHDLINKGYDTVNPVDLDEGIDVTNHTLSQFLSRDLAALTDCDVIVVLPGWEFSDGAFAEVATAWACKKPVLEAFSLKELSPTEVAKRLRRKLQLGHRTGLRRRIIGIVSRPSYRRRVVKALEKTSLYIPYAFDEYATENELWDKIGECLEAGRYGVVLEDIMTQVEAESVLDAGGIVIRVTDNIAEDLDTYPRTIQASCVTHDLKVSETLEKDLVDIARHINTLRRVDMPVEGGGIIELLECPISGGVSYVPVVKGGI